MKFASASAARVSTHLMKEEKKAEDEIEDDDNQQTNQPSQLNEAFFN